MHKVSRHTNFPLVHQGRNWLGSFAGAWSNWRKLDCHLSSFCKNLHYCQSNVRLEALLSAWRSAWHLPSEITKGPSWKGSHSAVHLVKHGLPQIQAYCCSHGQLHSLQWISSLRHLNDFSHWTPEPHFSKSVKLDAVLNRDRLQYMSKRCRYFRRLLNRVQSTEYERRLSLVVLQKCPADIFSSISAPFCGCGGSVA